jgi:hypothetical protein
MIGFLRGKAVTQVTEILLDQKVFTEDQIRKALKEYLQNHPDEFKAKRSKKRKG